jgi:hypothetical protein
MGLRSEGIELAQLEDVSFNRVAVVANLEVGIRPIADE